MQQARGDEVLNVISRSGATSFQQDFAALRHELGPGPGTLLTEGIATSASSAVPAAQAAGREAPAFYAASSRIFSLDLAAAYARETQLVLGSGTGSSAAGFASLQTDLTKAITADQAQFSSSASDASGAFGSLVPAIAIAAVLMAVGCAWGLSGGWQSTGDAMTIVATREQAVAAVAAAVTERDTIQANLLELDGSFGKRMLAGATLRGQSQQRWAAADAQLAALWQLFGAYSAVVDKAAQVAAGLGRSTSARIAEISSLLSGPSVRLAGVVTPLGRRDLTSGGQTDLPLQAAVAQMRQAFAIVSAVCTAAETVWNEVADRLQRASANLDTAKRQTAGIDDGALAGPLGAADANLSQLREQLNTDPLAFWQGGRADASRLDLLDSQVAAVAARASELAALRADADRRIAAVRAEVSAAQSAWQDAAAAQQRLAEKISGAAPRRCRTRPICPAASTGWPACTQPAGGPGWPPSLTR